MNDATLDTEVCVVGGGPAGAVCAKRLAELGHDVLVVERDVFPRPHVGEALTPAVWPLLDALGLRDAVEAAGFPQPLEARVRWIDARENRVLLRPDAPGLTVDRGHFDHLLLDAARTAGARVLQPARAGRPRRTAPGWEIPLTDAGLPGRRAERVRARFVVDAGGRASASGGRKVPTGARTLALHATWRAAPPVDPHPRVEAGPDGWFWGAPLPDGTFRAMAFIDPDLLRRRAVRRAGLGRFYRDLLAASTLAAHLADARLTDGVAVCDAGSYADPLPVAEDLIRLGEAAFAIDPLSSCGVDTAVQTAMAGAVTVHTLLSADGDRAAALAFYRDNQQRAVDRHATWAANHYHDHRTHRDRPFWQRRARPTDSIPAPRSGPDLVELLPRRVRLSPDATLVDTPCVVGDRVENRRALVHPDLPRPAVYVRDVELAPLLDVLSGPDRGCLADVVRTWSRHLPSDHARAVAAWLYRKGLLQFD
ncbi:tryptophan 7-halogenase (plasmid) [Embleya sp. NBC_00888]|uniref:flavin-dependent monooxygenase QhpG n=1 Tax=Embleya sp. NBC_00888 TaxID=2975960 RepID=UPI002F9141D0|nr:tryptophan 7-halogenase [Embleya sp. NBC_00888]